MVPVDDASEVRALLRVIAVKRRDGFFQGLEKFVKPVARHPYVVGGDAQLTGVHKASAHNAPRGDGHVGILADDGRVFSTELQRGGDQFFRGGGGDLAADLGSTGKKDMVERFL